MVTSVFRRARRRCRPYGYRRPGDERPPQRLVFGGQPFEELLQGTVLVAGMGGAVAAQQLCHPPLDVAAGDLLPAGPPGQAGAVHLLEVLVILQDVLLGEGGQVIGQSLVERPAPRG
jgi:hypothetical protein